MSYHGHSNTQRFDEKKTWPDRYLVQELDQTVTILDGKVTIVIPHLELVIIAKVKGTKGQGVADADGLVEPTAAHIEVLEALRMLDSTPQAQSFTIEFVMDIIDGNRAKRAGLFSNQLTPEQKVNRNAVRRTFSELLRKGAYMLVYGTKGRYAIDLNRINEILEGRKF